MIAVVNISLADMAQALVKFIHSYEFEAGQYELQDARLLYAAAETIKRKTEERIKHTPQQQA